MPLIRVARGGAVVLDLTRTGLELTADGLVEVYGYAQAYVAWSSEAPLEPVTPSPRGVRFTVAPADRTTVTTTLATILARPGILRPATHNPDLRR